MCEKRNREQQSGENDMSCAETFNISSTCVYLYVCNPCTKVYKYAEKVWKCRM